MIEFRGKPVVEVNKGIATLVDKCDVTDVTPHTLRHTCATWLMERGADMWQAAGYLGMTVAILERVYGHYRPDFQSSGVIAPPLDEIWFPEYHAVKRRQ